MLIIAPGAFQLNSEGITIPNTIRTAKRNLIGICIHSGLLKYTISDILPIGSTEKFLKLSVPEKINLSSEIIACILHQNKFIEIDDTFFEKIINLSKDLKSPPVFLQFKKKENQYIRILYFDNLNSLFLEKYLSWNNWLKSEKEIIACKLRLNENIRMGGNFEGPKSFRGLEKTVENIFEDSGISSDKFKMTIENRIVDVFWNGGGIIPSFDLLTSPGRLVYRLPGSNSKIISEKKQAAIIYSKNLQSSQEEAFQIASILEDHYATETQADTSLQYEISDFSLLHFSGHGEWKANAGYLKTSKGLVDKIQFESPGSTVFLAACHSGSGGSGIIENLIKAGAQSVIASPYEIPGPQHPGQEDWLASFYKDLYVAGAELSYRINALKHDSFGRCMRLYSSYPDKI